MIYIGIVHASVETILSNQSRLVCRKMASVRFRSIVFARCETRQSYELLINFWMVLMLEWMFFVLLFYFIDRNDSGLHFLEDQIALNSQLPFL